VREATVASSISRKNRERAISIFGNMGEGLSQQESLNKAEEVAKSVLTEGYNFRLSGSAEEFMKSFVGLMIAMLLGFVVAYMVLASQFNSFVDPFTVFVAMPFSFSGAFLGLLLGGQTINLFSMIGLVLLLGIVKKNSILLVDFTNQAQERGKPVREALLEACPNRLRPILMTSIATIAGALPAAVALGPGAEARQPMAIAVIGGVLVSTLLTLYVVPSVYSLLAGLHRQKKHEEEDESGQAEPSKS
jgi:HAE1 family hydrophobic/amphiphilic exporter-1